MVLLEAAFERARMRTAPRLASRLDAVLAWGDLGFSQRFRAEYRPAGVVHRCALVAGTSSRRSATERSSSRPWGTSSRPWRPRRTKDLRRVEARAERYWRAREPMALPELLVHGTVVEVEAVVGGETRCGRRSCTLKRGFADTP